MKKRTENPCKGCIWRKRISEGLIYCPFPACVKNQGTTPEHSEAGRGRARERAELLPQAETRGLCGDEPTGQSEKEWEELNGQEERMDR